MKQSRFRSSDNKDFGLDLSRNHAGHDGEDVFLFCAFALKRALEESIIPAFTRTTGVTVQVVFEPTGRLLRRLEHGEKPDLFIGISGALSSIRESQDFNLESTKKTAKVGIGVAVPSGSQPPKISSVADLTQTLTNARSVAYASNGPSGIYFASLLQELGIAETVNSRATILREGPVARALTDGRADVAIQQMSELMLVPEVGVAVPLPRPLQRYTEFTTTSSHAAGLNALGLFNVITSRRSREAFAKAGLEPLA